MKFTETELSGAYLIEPEFDTDERGFFARTFCQREFSTRGLNSTIAQCNISFNKQRGTLRGMHYQTAPSEEVKLVRCTMGAIYDVIVDLRPKSASFGKWYAVELNAQNRRMLYIPHGFAHGFQTLMDASEVQYQMSTFYVPDHARGIRWDDPAFGIRWPHEVKVISERDKHFPDFST